MTYDYGVFIGRFQPLHEGHQRVIDTALEQVDKLIILVGSANHPRTIRNPFTFGERRDFLLANYPEEIRDNRIIIKPLNDFLYRNTHWVRQVQDIVNYTVLEDHPQWRDEAFKIALVGSQKDSTGFYLNMFPQWDSIPVVHKIPLNSTDMREFMYEEGDAFHHLNKRLPGMSMPTLHVLWEYTNTDWFRKISEEYLWNKEYKKQFDGLRYPPTHSTVDAVVIQSGSVLLV